MPMIELTDEELGHLCDAVYRGLESLDDQLDDYREEQHYSAEDWAAMQAERNQWARMLRRLTNARKETANAND